jgi:hypothetical protein
MTAPWPRVTVQLPIYNERYVVERLIAAVGCLDYPSDRLEIQVLDDSTDQTTDLAGAAVRRLQERGLRATHLHRADRQGFKAGALEAGTRVAVGELLAVFDADFMPPSDFLMRLVPHFQDADVGMVQARWGHLNADDSWLTGVQATLLDAHFIIEHTARHAAGRWFNFNGTAGIWRRQAIDDAGGWSHDTVTEDMDLSYRAQLVGWRFVYRVDVVAPAELPHDMAAFKVQQHRWAKGSIQTARKLLGRIWRSSAPLGHKIEATQHLGANVSYPLVFCLTVLMPAAVVARIQGARFELLLVDAGLFGVALLPFVVYYAAAIFGGDAARVWGRSRQLPLVLSVGLGLAVAQSRAVWDGLRADGGRFIRTPKRGSRRQMGYRAAGRGLVGIELAMGGSMLAFVVWIAGQSPASVPFLLLFGVGYTLVGWASLRSRVVPTNRPNSAAGQVSHQSQGASNHVPAVESQVSKTA